MNAVNPNVLRENFDLSMESKADTGGQVSVATTSGGEFYYGGHVSSDTHLTDIPSEQVALLRAAQERNYRVEHVATMTERDLFTLSPISLKVMIDFAQRVRSTIGYSVISTEGETLVDTEDVSELLPIYRPNIEPLSGLDQAEKASNVIELGAFTVGALRQATIEGSNRTFPTRAKSTNYGAAALSESGLAYVSGQYSSYDFRTNVHAEVGAVTSAMMHRDDRITHIGVVSTKHQHEPVSMCGSCRQFVSEVSKKSTIDPQILTFAYDNEESRSYTIDEYLPDKWSSKT